MTERFDKNDMPDLQAFPSAQAQEVTPIQGDASPPVSRKNFRPFVFVFRVFMALLVLGVVGLGVLFLVLSNGAVSHEQLRAQIETQFTNILGGDYNAKIAGAKIAFGANGLIALDATDVKILKNNKINLGVASEVAIKVKALPLLKGKVVAESISVRDASISLPPFLAIDGNETGRRPWPKAIDFTSSFTALGEMFAGISKSIDESGLDNIKLYNANIIGFDQLGLLSTSGRILELSFERNVNFQQGLFFSGVIETDQSNWKIRGKWKDENLAGRILDIKIEGLKISDFIPVEEGGEPTVSKLDNAVRLSFISPYRADGSPKQATLRVEIGAGELDVNGKAVSKILGAVLNLRFFPEKNQIELERSPLHLETTQAILLGGVRYPRVLSATGENRPLFQVIAHDLLAYGMTRKEKKMVAALNLEGWIDTDNRTLVATSINLKTEEGGISGAGQISFAQRSPHLSANLAIAEMTVRAFKQFWPKIIAPVARKWINDGVVGGAIKRATVKLDFPPGVLGKDELYTPDNISATIPVFGSTVKTVGNLPPLSKVAGVVKFAGTKTSIQIEKAQLNLGKRGSIDVRKSSLLLGDYTKVLTTATLNLSLKGKASTMAKLGTMKPLNFTHELKINPTDLRGTAKAKVKASFALEDVERKGLKNWSASVKLTEVGSRRPIFGRKIGNANLQVEASSGITKITGTARVDGVPAKLSMVEKTGSKRSSQRTVTLTLNDAARKKLGADTGAVLTGPIDVVLTSLAGGGEKIVANLKRARLNFPWIGWSKGKGIPATAEFVLKRQKGRAILSGFRLKGKGFSAAGRLEFSKSGLRKAALKKIRLNKTDDFDVTATRTKNGYAIDMRARSYDGRAIIQAFMKSKRGKAKGGVSVSVKGRIAKLIGFGGQVLRDVTLSFSQRGNRVRSAVVNGMAAGNAPTIFSLQPVKGGMNTKISTSNAGSTLRFLDLYSKMRGGTITANLVRDKSLVYKGRISARNFTLLGEPRLAKMLKKPVLSNISENRGEVVTQLKRIATDKVKVDKLRAQIVMGQGYLALKDGRLAGGDASATFAGRVYDQNNRMSIKGTYLPGRALNKLVSKIPIIGLAFGKGKVNGLLGITFKLTGRYGNPKLSVNPLSIIAPGVFRQLFKF